MLKHLTFLNWIEWISIVVLQFGILKLSWVKVKTLSISMAYLIVESVILFIIVILGSPQLYSKAFYFLSIIECLLFSMTSIELGSNCIERMSKNIRKYGAFIIAAPTFCIITIFYPFVLKNLLAGTIRISQIAFLLSLSLLFICFGFEDKDAKNSLIARSYAALLSLLTLCTGLQLKFGFADFVRQGWIISWIIGLSLILWSLIRCRYNGNSNINRRTTYGYSGEHGA